MVFIIVSWSVSKHLSVLWLGPEVMDWSGGGDLRQQADVLTDFFGNQEMSWKDLGIQNRKSKVWFPEPVVSVHAVEHVWAKVMEHDLNIWLPFITRNYHSPWPWLCCIVLNYGTCDPILCPPLFWWDVLECHWPRLPKWCGLPSCRSFFFMQMGSKVANQVKWSADVFISPTWFICVF